jgi:hypothetical protein
MQPLARASRRQPVDAATDIHYVHELIAALDRRLPQAERADAATIARDRATLRARAVARLAELERERRLSQRAGSYPGTRIPAQIHRPVER